ncbi:hypothetical protein [Vibrio parahaemolyticus]|uniref:hypothetical protein n=1 Tax=Vibrio parahaemolyticus TaxID=670 RepID=UPI00235FBB1A|nr:hypothetical protein [Vibrio parahaemolyticus]
MTFKHPPREHEHLRSFTDNLTMSKIEYLTLFLKKHNLRIRNRKNILDEIDNNILDNIETDTIESLEFDNLFEEHNILNNKIEDIYDLLKVDDNYKLIEPFQKFHDENKLSSQFNHKFSINIKNLESSQRLIYWYWGYIQIKSRKFRHSSPNLSDKYNDIIKYLNKTDKSPRRAKLKIEKIYSDYQRISKENFEMSNFLSKSKINKISKNTNELEYKSKFIFNEINKSKRDDIEHINNIFTYTVNDNYYSICIAIFDLIDNQYLRENLINKFSRKWSDHKHREKMKEKNITKKQISLNNETSTKLSKIEDHYICNSSDTITRLINQEYDRLFKRADV